MARLGRPQLDQIEAIRQRFALRIPEKVQAIEQTARQLRSRGPEPELVERLFQDAHGLAGSAAIFGFKDVAAAAAALETLMTSPPASADATSSWKRQVASAAQRLRRSTAR